MGFILLLVAIFLFFISLAGLHLSGRYELNIRNILAITIGGTVGFTIGMYYWASSVDYGFASFRDSGTLLGTAILFGTFGLTFLSLVFFGEKSHLKTDSN